jgi:hypothetical protein
MRPRERPTLGVAIRAPPACRHAFNILDGKRILSFWHMQAFAPLARWLLIEIDRDDRRRFNVIGIAPVGLCGGDTAFVRSDRRRRSGPVVGRPKGTQSNAGKRVGRVVDRFLCGKRGSIRFRCQRGSRKHKLVGVCRFRAPYGSAARTADLPAVRGQACGADIVGRGARRADNQHRRIMAASTSRHPSADPLTDWKPCRPVPGPC